MSTGDDNITHAIAYCVAPLSALRWSLLLPL